MNSTIFSDSVLTFVFEAFEGVLLLEFGYTFWFERVVSDTC